MHPRLRARRNATIERRIRELEAAKRVAVERLVFLQELLAGLPEDVPEFDRETIVRALSAARQAIDDADAAHVERWEAMVPLLTSTNRLVESVVNVLKSRFPAVAARP